MQSRPLDELPIFFYKILDDVVRSSAIVSCVPNGRYVVRRGAVLRGDEAT